MLVRDVVNPKVEAIYPQTLLKDAAQLMRSLNIELLAVCNGDRLVGVLSDHDIIVRSAARGLEPKKSWVYEVMTTELVCCFDDQDIQEAAKTLQEKRIRRLAVIDRNKRFIGFVSLGDLTAATSEQTAPDTVIMPLLQPVQV
jgi:CBS domain-containing protein